MKSPVTPRAHIELRTKIWPAAKNAMARGLTRLCERIAREGWFFKASRKLLSVRFRGGETKSERQPEAWSSWSKGEERRDETHRVSRKPDKEKMVRARM